MEEKEGPVAITNGSSTKGGAGGAGTVTIGNISTKTFAKDE